MCVHTAVTCHVMPAERQGLQTQEEDATGTAAGGLNPHLGTTTAAQPVGGHATVLSA